MKLTFTGYVSAGPGAIFPANSRRRTHKVIAWGTSEMDLVANKILWPELGSMSRGFQGGAGGGCCGRKKKGTRGRLVTCGISLPTSSGILCLRIYTCLWAVQKLHGKRLFNASFTVIGQRNSHFYESEVYQHSDVMLCIVLWKVWCIIP